jgi:steroid 5-alpha reductase family enzyme
MRTVTIVQIIFLAMWEIHYIDRSFIYPLTRRISKNPFPLAVLMAGLAFNIMNAYLNSNYIINNTPKYVELWLDDLRFLSGLGLFLLGFVMNRHSDYVLYHVRRISQQDYSIPQNGFFRWISCPNYLGEIVIWLGWTVATWSPVAAAFLLWTVANLVPRARSHHRWYQQHFDNYPDGRRALVPWIW